jgi:hypothetical protein
LPPAFLVQSCSSPGHVRKLHTHCQGVLSSAAAGRFTGFMRGGQRGWRGSVAKREAGPAGRRPPPLSRLRRLLPVGAALGETRLATGGGAQHGRAVAAIDHSLGVAEDAGDCEAVEAPHVHEKRVGLLYQPEKKRTNDLSVSVRPSSKAGEAARNLYSSARARPW